MTIAISALSDRLVFFLAVNTGLVTDGLPDARYVEFYRRRSSALLHCAIIGNVVVPGGHGSNGVTPKLTRDRIWADVAEAIKTAGSIPGMQLSTAWDGYSGAKEFLSKSGKNVIEEARHLVQTLGPDGLEKVMDSFFLAGAMAVDHGFGHVQVHAAHGYLPSLLIDDRINANAARVRERFAKMAEWLGSQQVETSIRISLRTGDPEFDDTGVEVFLDMMTSLPFDFIDLSSGFYNINKRLIYPSRPEILASRHEESLAVARRHPNRQFIISGRIMNKKMSLPQNAHIGICRDLIANARFLSEPGNGCRNYGKCHYYSRGGDHVTCLRWTELSKTAAPCP